MIIMIIMICIDSINNGVIMVCTYIYISMLVSYNNHKTHMMYVYVYIYVYIYDSYILSYIVIISYRYNIYI